LPQALAGRFEPYSLKEEQDGGYPLRLRRKKDQGDAGGVPVILHLLHPTNEAPFYLMQDKVWNDLYREFVASDQGKAAVPPSTTWQQGARKGNGKIGPDDGGRPVVRVTQADAARFAKWMKGKLPTPEQLDFAAGYRERKPEWTSPGEGKAAVRLQEPRPVHPANEAGDVSPRKIHDLFSNGYEWTSEVVSIAGKPYATLRGHSYRMQRPLSYDDLDEWNKKDTFLIQDVTYPSPETGFRVVFPCD
jgi:formylglycine-generating enzyme required for sulfatase activity